MNLSLPLRLSQLNHQVHIVYDNFSSWPSVLMCFNEIPLSVCKVELASAAVTSVLALSAESGFPPDKQAEGG